MKKGTRATYKNCRADDIIQDDEGYEYVVWEEPAALNRYGAIRLLGENGEFRMQSNLLFPRDDGKFVHTGKTWVEQPPAEFDTSKSMVRIQAGWLTRDGVFYACGYAEHKQITSRLWDSLKPQPLTDRPESWKDEDPTRQIEERGLEVAGWIKLTSAMILGRHPHWERPEAKKITSKQFDVVLQWCSDNQRPLPGWLNRTSLIVDEEWYFQPDKQDTDVEPDGFSLL